MASLNDGLIVEMLGIRDTIQSPILMWENRDQTMTQFLIPTNTNMLYTFEIKVENYAEIYGISDEEDSRSGEYSTICDVMDDSIEALVVDEAVDPDAVAEAMATPDLTLSDIEYVEETVEEYSSTDDKPGVEVVGVVWPEHEHKNKVYKYDPNGTQLSEGDMVLVPTRDASKNKDVIRKAVIAHANHVIDPDKHPHPLKKIIAVIKRHAYAALTPDKDESKE